MRRSLLELLVCTCCGGSDVQLTDFVLAIRYFRETNHSGVVEEGTVSCDRCPAVFPVICGVPILVPHFEDYIAARKNELIKLCSVHGASQECLFLVQGAKEGLGWNPGIHRSAWRCTTDRTIPTKRSLRECCEITFPLCNRYTPKRPR